MPLAPTAADFEHRCAACGDAQVSRSCPCLETLIRTVSAHTAVARRGRTEKVHRPLPVREPYLNAPLRRRARAVWSKLKLPSITHLTQDFARLPRGCMVVAGNVTDKR